MIPEERLRRHLEASARAELVVERSVASIERAGVRRRRQQRVLAGVVVVVAILGAAAWTALRPENRPADFASERSAANVAAPVEAEIFDTEVLDVEDAFFNREGSTVAVGVLGASSSIVSVADGFVGVTAETGALTVARSPDGLSWDEVALVKTPDEAAFPASQLIHHDGAFAMILQSFGETGTARSMLASTTDLERWTFLDLDSPNGVDLWVVGLTLSDRGVFVLVNQQDLRPDVGSGTTNVVWTGPVDGPLQRTELRPDSFQYDSLVEIGAGWLAGGYDDGGFSGRTSIRRSTDGVEWTDAAAGPNLRESVVFDDRILSIGESSPDTVTIVTTGFDGESSERTFSLPFEIHGRWVSSVRMGEAGVALAIAGNRDPIATSILRELLPTDGDGAVSAVVFSADGDRWQVFETPQVDDGWVDLVAIGDDELLFQQRSLASGTESTSWVRVPLS